VARRACYAPAMIRIETITVGPFQSTATLSPARDRRRRHLRLRRRAPAYPGRGARAGVHVKAIINTHAHIDHVSGLAGVVDALGVPVFMHRADVPV